MKPNETDKKLLQLLQSSFPLVSRPFRRIAETLVIEESEVVERTKRLKEAGIIRRIGPSFNPKAFGYRSCLFAAKVPAENEEDAANYINTFRTVTHNYKREGSYNIWFTFAFKEEHELKELFSKLKSDYGATDILRLPATKMYKLRTEFHAK